MIAIPERPEDLDYELPEALVAQRPLDARDGGRLLVLSREDGAIRHQAVQDLPALLPPRSLLVVNDVRVEPARVFGVRPTGGKVEILVLERRAGDLEALAQASKPLRVGQEVRLPGGVTLRIAEIRGGGRVRFEGDVGPALEAAGEVPLPPYIRRAPDEADADRYQTVYARTPGAVAAPTAGLHFTPALLEAIERAGHSIAPIWLAVGPGTFRPVRAARLEDHEMDEERYRVPEATAAAIDAAKREGRPVVAVGTTVVRTLESMQGPGEGRTALFIRPPFAFRVVDALLTNFHLPRSTLLALVAAFAGTERVLAAYRLAVREGYRFYSYGDAMLVR